MMAFAFSDRRSAPGCMRRCCGGGLRAIDRRFGLYSRANAVVTILAVVFLAGLLSLSLGQDSNWDLRNYHMYNGYAWLNDRISHDLAPAQLQTYFSPVLDVVQYLLLTQLPAPLAGFVMGVVHGVVFVPLLAIVWVALEGRPQRAWAAPLLALAGMCGSAFLSEFGSTMADNTTLLAVLAALALSVYAQRANAGRSWLFCSLAGVCLGIAVACKLTNAIYALALGVMTLAVGGAWRRRLQAAIVLTAAAVLTFAALAGPFYLRVWQEYGNPLFPQFNTVFQAPLAQSLSVVDQRWGPRGLLEHVLWPLWFTFNPRRVSEISLSQCSWALLYLLVVLAALRKLWRKSADVERATPALRAVLIFFLVAYLLWQLIFAIHRYLAMLDVLMPLLLWFFCQQVLPKPWRARGAGLLIGGSALVALVGWKDWGHEPWARRSFEVASPVMQDPRRSLVLLVGGEPLAWRIPFMPAAAVYASVASNFPESALYRQRIADLSAKRDERYALLPAEMDRWQGRVARMNAWVARLGLADQPGCRGLRWLVAHGLRGQVHEQSGICSLLPRTAARDLDAGNQAIRDVAGQQLAGYGLVLQQASCQLYSSRIGRTEYPYQWCRVHRSGDYPRSGEFEPRLAQQL